MRQATNEDIPALLAMADCFINDLHHPSNVGIDKESLTNTFSYLINDPNGVIIIADGGAIGGLCFPYYFNAKHLSAQEFFWWVNEDSRKNGTGMKLFNAFSEWAKEKGVKSLTMIGLHNQNTEKMHKIYENHGFSKVETHYVRAL